MSFTLSLLLFFVLVRFVLPRVLRAVFGGFVRQQVRKAGFDFRPPVGATPPPAGPPPAPGQVRVEYVPPTAATSERSASFKGGEYVDFEEVK